MADLFDEFGIGGEAPQATDKVDLFDEFGVAAEPVKTGLTGTLKEGAKSSFRSVGAAVDAYQGDTAELVEAADDQRAAPRDARLTNFYDAVDSRAQAAADESGEEAGLWDSVKAVGGAIADEPTGAGLAVAENAPNAAVTLGAGWAGMKLGAAGGAALGSVIPVLGTGVGAAVGGVLGGLAGLFLGNTALETGGRALSAGADGEVTPEELAAARSEGAVKGGVITAVDAATLGIGGVVSKAMMRPAQAAMESATRRVLIDNGIDVADKAAVLAAREVPEIGSAVKAAQESALESVNTLGRKATQGGVLLALESSGEGVGEYLGEMAATGQGDVTDAVLESFLAMVQSGAEAAWTAGRTRVRPMATPENPNPEPVELPDPANGALSAAAQSLAAEPEESAPPGTLPAQQDSASSLTAAAARSPAALPQPAEQATDADAPGALAGIEAEASAPESAEDSEGEPALVDKARRARQLHVLWQDETDLSNRIAYLTAQGDKNGWNAVITAERLKAMAELEQVRRQIGVVKGVVSTPSTPAPQATAAAQADVPPPQQSALPLPAAPAGAPQESVASIAGADIDGDWARFTPESGTLQIPRAEMPQIKAEHRGAMVNFLKARDVGHEQTEMPAAELKPTQAEFSRKKVARAKKFDGGDRSILVSADGYVLDGHHQWMAKRDAGEVVKVIRLNAPIEQLLSLAREFPSSELADGAIEAAPAVQSVEPDLEASQPPEAAVAEQSAPAQQTTEDGAEQAPRQVDIEPDQDAVSTEQATDTEPQPQQESPAEAPATPVPAEGTAHAPAPVSKPPAKPKVAAKQPEAVEDAGEKLGGARKDELRSVRDRLESMDDEAIAASTLSELWPKGEIDKIDDPFHAAAYWALRSEIPAKPRVAYKLQRWVTKIKEARLTLGYLASLGADVSLAELRKASPALRSFANKVELLAAVERSQWPRVGRVEHRTGQYSENGEMVPGSWFEVEIDKRRQLFRGHDTMGSALPDIKKALAPDSAPAQEMKFAIYSSRLTGRAFIIKDGDKEKRHLKDFDDVKSAKAYLQDNHAQLVEAWEAVKNRDNVTRSDTRRRSNAPRVGEDYREGQDVTPEQFLEAFGFRGVEFGNWVGQGKGGRERQGMLNEAFDAFMDLAGVVGVPPKALSLEGTLGIGFGSRGKGGWAAAHFEPDQVVINLTKTKGAGSLAHEWFHALDNYFSRKRGGEVPMKGRGKAAQNEYLRNNFVTYRPEPLYVHTSGRGKPITLATLNRYHQNNPTAGYYDPAAWHPDPSHPEGVRPEVERAFAELVETLDDSPMRIRASSLDKTPDGYWSQIIERGARSFETYVIAKLADQGARNDYLANVTTLDEFSRSPERYPYLTPDEQGPVSEAFDKLFATVETREQEGGMALFSRRPVGAGAVSNTLSRGDVEQVAIRLVTEPTVASRFVFASWEELPQAIKDAAAAQGALPSDVKAVHWRGKTYLVDRRFATERDVERAIFHEFYAHYGLRQRYGKDLESHLVRMLPKVGGIKGVQAIAQAQGFNIDHYITGALNDDRLTNRRRGALIMDELLAHMAESTGSLKRVLQEWYGLVRDWFRRKGYDELATLDAADLALVLRRARQAAVATDSARNDAGPAFYVDSALQPGDELGSSDLESDNPDIRFSLAPSNIPRGVASSALGQSLTKMLRGKLTDLKPAGLGALPLMYLRDFAPKGMTALDGYMDQKRAMDADRNEMHTKYDAIAQAWLKQRLTSGTLGDKAKAVLGKGVTADRALDQLMHDATVEGIDPSKPRKDEADRVKYQMLRKRFEALPAEQQVLFNEVRDAYQEQIQTLESAIEQNVIRSVEFSKRRARRERNAEITQARDELTGDDLQEAIDAAEKRYRGRMRAAEAGTTSKVLLLRQKFESMRIDEPYFPLKRFGDYFVALRDGEKLVSFSMFESAAAMEDAAEQMRAKYPDMKVKVGRKSIKQELEGAVDVGFVSDIQDLVSRLPNADEIADQVYQLYLDTLPDFSMRKGFIHRKKVSGYSDDALRAFASSMFHSSYQIARLKHSLEMNELVDVVEEQAQAATDPVDAMTIANELRRRHEWVMNPKGSRVAQTITSAAFTYQLGITPAAAMVNTTQTFMLGVPVLGARYKSEAKAMTELLKASRDFIKGKGHLERALTGEEQEAFAEFMRLGLIDKTQAHDLAGVGETGAEYSPVRHKLMGIISWAFHNAERYNREVTSIAAYRMARAAGRSHADAISEAADLTWTIHFDYSSGNRARFMQSDTAKVLLVFRQHSVNMLSRLVIDIRQSLKGESPELRAEAKRRLAGIYGMFALMAGMLGVPGAQALLLLLNALDDDDDPWTAEDKIKRAVTEALGEDVAAAFFKGAPGTLADLNLTDRIGMGHLWFFSPNREVEGRDAYVYWVEQVLGAAPAMVANAFTGASMMGEGHVMRGFETMLPKAGKDVLRAVRYSEEGVQSLNGYSLLDEVGGWGVLAQALGFMPAHIAQRYDQNNALKNAEMRIKGERQYLFNRYALAVRTGDTEALPGIRERIADFNKRYPAVRITNSALIRSVNTRESNQERAADGILIDRRLEYLRSEQ